MRSRNTAGKKSPLSAFSTLLQSLPSQRERQQAEQNKRQLLTSAYSDLAVVRGAEVAEEPFVRIAGIPLGAKVAQLLGANAAAPTAVQDQAYPGRALGGQGGALALRAALLAGRFLGRQRKVETGSQTTLQQVGPVSKEIGETETDRLPASENNTYPAK